MANFLFYKYRFEKTGERTLFSAEDNAHVSNEYLNDKFAVLIGERAEAKFRKLNLYVSRLTRRA